MPESSGMPRLFLSPPHMGPDERELLLEAFDSNWIAPLGPQVDALEVEFAERVGAGHAVALASGTAAIHLALLLHRVGAGDDVLVSSLTFSASVNPVCYVGARPVLIDSERESWNLDANLLEDALRERAGRGPRVGAVIAVHLYGQSADLDAVRGVCERYGVPLIEDAAEALGARYKERHPGNDGAAGIFSFNGNKIITTSGGGMLVTPDGALAQQARKLATQARDPAPHYQHSEVGYNYGMSNLLAAVGMGQLRVLDDRVQARRTVFERYVAELGDVPGLAFQPEASWARHTRWLSCVLVDPAEFGCDREAIRLALEAENIESRPLWKPMHRQPVFADAPVYGGVVSEELFERGLCLPSGSAMSPDDQQRVVDVIRSLAAGE